MTVIEWVLQCLYSITNGRMAHTEMTFMRILAMLDYFINHVKG